MFNSTYEHVTGPLTRYVASLSFNNSCFNIVYIDFEMVNQIIHPSSLLCVLCHIDPTNINGGRDVIDNI